MSELDDVLRQSFARIAEPGDPAGVAEAMRTRLAAGDTGTPAATSGFGSSAGWVVPWLFGGALLAVGGLLLGTSGLLNPLLAPEPVAQTVQLTTSVDALDCPDGAPVAELAAGNRVLVVARSDDSAYLGVRNPYDTAATVWLPAAVVVADADQPAIDSLPVDGCGTADTTLVAPTAEPTAPPTPTETQAPTPPKPAADRTIPTLGNPTATPAEDICAYDSYSAYYAVASVIAVTASDNVAVAGVSISWTGVATGSSQMTGSGTSWTFSFNPPEATPTGNVTFVLQARDAAGNLSGTKQTVVAVISGGSCLI